MKTIKSYLSSFLMSIIFIFSKNYDIFKPEACDEYLAMYNIIEQKIDTGDILYDHYKNKYGREFRERG